MGEVIQLFSGRPGLAAASPRVAERRRVTLFFDLASPYTYLAAERADRLLPSLRWTPVSGRVLRGGEAPMTGAVRALAEARAEELRMPLSWPDRYPFDGRMAQRVAAHAAEEGRAAAFVLAASRLAFCGGFDLDDVETLAEAAAAACLGLDACLDAAADVRRDGKQEEAARTLLAGGADQLPAIRVGGNLLAGEQHIAQAAGLLRTPLSLGGGGIRRRQA